MVTSLVLERAEGREALRRLFREYRFGGSVAPDVEGTVSVRLRNVPFETALANVTRQLGATFRIDHGFFRVVRGKDPDTIVDPAWLFGGAPTPAGRRDVFRSGQGPPRPIVEGRLSLVPLPVALRRIFAGTGVAWKADPRFGRSVSVDVTGLAFESALPKLVRENRLELSPRRRRLRVLPALPGTPLVDDREVGSNVRAVRFEATDVHVALSWLFQTMGVPYAIDPSVRGFVTAEYQDVDFEMVVLRTILDEVDATWRVAGGVYFVLPRRASTGTVRFAALYDRLHRAATRGDRAEIDRLLSPNLARPAPEDPAAWPIFSFPTGVRPARVAVVVAVEGERPEITRLYLDGWERGADGSWWLTSRRPYAPRRGSR